jgi:SH3-like domain-containing protein
MARFKCFLFFIILFAFNQAAIPAQKSIKTGIYSGLPIPRYVSLKSEKVKLRIGPGKKYRTQYVYVVKNFPVKIIAEFDNWRKIRDIDGSEGWIHTSMLSGNRYVLLVRNKIFFRNELARHIAKSQSILFSSDTEKSVPVAKIELGTVLKLKKCKEKWCKVAAEGISGWVRKENLFGAN